MKVIKYRLLTQEDCDIFFDIRLIACKTSPDSFLEDYEELIAQPYDYRKKYFENGWLAGAFSEGKLIGIAGLHKHKGRKLEHKGTIWGVFVRPEFRQTGIAKHLINMLLHEAKTAALEHVLLSANTKNKAAITLYEKLGFSAWGVQRNIVKTSEGYQDDVHMVKVL